MGGIFFTVRTVFLPAVFTDSVKIGLMSCDFMICKVLGKLVDTVNNLHGNIVNGAAFCANMMIMRNDNPVKTIRFPTAADLTDLPQRAHKTQIPVYRSQTDIRVLFPELLINNIGCGMIGPMHEKHLDGISLTTVFQHGNQILQFVIKR